MGLGLDQGLLEQTAIANGAGAAAITAPFSGEGLDTPAELIGSTADGAISATGPAMQQQMDRPATAALEQGGLQFSEGLGAGVVVIGLQLLGKQTDGGGELLGLDAQLPERTGALEGAGRPGGLGEGRSGGGGENGHGDV